MVQYELLLPKNDLRVLGMYKKKIWTRHTWSEKPFVIVAPSLTLLTACSKVWILTTLVCDWEEFVATWFSLNVSWSGFWSQGLLSRFCWVQLLFETEAANQPRQWTVNEFNQKDENALIAISHLIKKCLY